MSLPCCSGKLQKAPEKIHWKPASIWFQEETIISLSCSETGQEIVTLPVDGVKGQLPVAAKVFCISRLELTLPWAPGLTPAILPIRLLTPQEFRLPWNEYLRDTKSDDCHLQEPTQEHWCGNWANDRTCEALLQKQSSHIFYAVLAFLGSPHSYGFLIFADVKESMLWGSFPSACRTSRNENSRVALDESVQVSPLHNRALVQWACWWDEYCSWR